MGRILYFKTRVICMLYILVFPAYSVEYGAIPNRSFTKYAQQGDNIASSSRNIINIMTERTPLSKAMRQVMLYIFKFHDARLEINDVILHNEQKEEDDSKKEYEGGKRGGQNEFEKFQMFSVERAKPHGQENIDDQNKPERTNEKEKYLMAESVNTKVQSDQQLDYETSVIEAVKNKTNGNFPESINATIKYPKETEGEDAIQDNIFLGSTSSCDHVTGYYRHRWLRLVVMCPTHWTNETVRNRCETWDEVHGLRYIDEITMLPVQDSLGTVYGNAFCAICHNAYPIYPWTTVLQCNTPTHYNSESMSLTNMSDLNLTFLQKLHDASFCKRIIMPSFPASIERCQNHHQWPKDIYFRSNPLESLGMPSSFPVNFNVLMNFDFTGETHILFSAGQQVVQNEYVRRCNVGETFDTYSKMCRPVRCSSSHRLEAGKCVPKGDTVDGESMSDDFDVSALHETAKVSLSVNMSFGLYLIFKEQDDLNAIVAEQIAGNLNISMDRIKHVNVSFDFGSVNKTGYQVQKLSRERYKEYFPNDTDANDFSKSSSIIDTLSDKDHLKGRSSQRRQKRNVAYYNHEKKVSVAHSSHSEYDSDGNFEFDKSHGKSPDPVLDENERIENTLVTKKQRSKSLWKTVLAKLVGHKVKTVFTSNIHSETGKKRVSGGGGYTTADEEKDNGKHSKISELDRNRAKRTNELKPTLVSTSLNKSTSHLFATKKDQKTKTTPTPNQWQKIQELSFNHLLSNASNWDTLWSLLRPLGVQGERTNQSNATDRDTRQSIFNNTSNTEHKIYLSPPLNKENDRMLLGADSEIDFDQPMAMRISFILVPPDDPGSDEEQAMALLKKIADLITDREFTLLVSGNEVSVVNSDDRQEDEDKANQFCPRGVMFIVYDDEFTILEIENITMLYVNKTKTYHGIGRFDLWVMVKGKNSAYETSVTNLKEYAFVCFMPRIIQVDCKRITLTTDEYKVISADNRSIIFEEDEYNITMYSVLNETSGEIQICVPQSYDSNKGQIFPHYFSISSGCGSDFDDVREAEGYLTLILGRISIAAQALVLITYFLFPSLRNLPGCNIMNLTLALFIAETIFEEGMLATTEWRCVTVAMTLHFFFLASHFWMNVMSFDVFRAFSKSNLSSSGKNDKQNYFPKYFLYAWGMPAIIVGICSFIEFSDLFGDVAIGYGGTKRKHRNSNGTFIYSNFLFGDQQNVIQDVNIIEEDVINQRVPTNNITFTNSLVKDSQTACWIQNPLSSLVAFGAPILLIFILNCIFFTRTIINISRTVKLTNESLYRQHSQHSNSSYSKTTGRSEAMLYLRMSTVMGFTWVFGFSSAIISSVANEITTTICVVVHVHSILFVIFNISQGLFIFVAFVCNRRVLRLYTGLFFRLKRFIRRRSHKSKIYSISSENSTVSSSTKSSSISRISW